MKLISKQKGFLMVEVLVASSIIVVVILSAMTVAQKSISLSRQSINATQAAFLLEEGAEAVRIRRDNAWSNISSLTAGTNYYPLFSGGTWTLSASASTVDIFTRKVVISNVNRNASSGDISSVGVNDPGTKLVTVTVSWDQNGQTISKVMSFYILDIFS